MERHLPLTDEALAALGVEAEEVISDGPPGRQWHAAEILAALTDRGSGHLLSVDKYVLDIALQRSAGLRRLGRMVWTNGQDDDSGVARIDQRQAIVALLQQAGRPLRANELRQRLVAIRGINEHFQIMALDPLIRVGVGIWGLNDRDVAVKRPEQPRLLDEVVQVLHQRGTALHATELGPEIVPVDGLSVTALLSLCAADPRMHVSVAQYLYLAAWGSPRRESISEAIERILKTAQSGLPFEEIHLQVEARIGRPCDRSAISGYLQAADAVWDQALGKWSQGVREEFVDEDLAPA
jgi:hypothetical protein